MVAAGVHVVPPAFRDTAVMPAGIGSVNAIWLSGPVVLGFEIEKLSVVFPPSAMLFAAKVLLMLGGATTVRVPPAGKLLPPSTELTVTVLVIAPAAVPLMLTVTVQVAFTARVITGSVTVLDPATAVAPPQVPPTFAGVPTTMPLGSVSVKPTPVSGIVLVAGLVIEMVMPLLPFRGTEAGLNDLVTVGGAPTARVAVLLAAPVPPLVEEMVPAPLTVLLFRPDVVPVTFTESVHVAPGVAMAPPVRPTLVAPA